MKGNYRNEQIHSTELRPISQIMDDQKEISPEDIQQIPLFSDGLGEGPAHDMIRTLLAEQNPVETVKIEKIC